MTVFVTSNKPYFSSLNVDHITEVLVQTDPRALEHQHTLIFVVDGKQRHIAQFNDLDKANLFATEVIGAISGAGNNGSVNLDWLHEQLFPTQADVA